MAQSNRYVSARENSVITFCCWMGWAGVRERQKKSYRAASELETLDIKCPWPAAAGGHRACARTLRNQMSFLVINFFGSPLPGRGTVSAREPSVIQFLCWMGWGGVRGRQKKSSRAARPTERLVGPQRLVVPQRSRRRGDLNHLVAARPSYGTREMACDTKKPYCKLLVLPERRKKIFLSGT